MMHVTTQIFKMQQITKFLGKMLQQIKIIVWEKWVWSFKTENPTSHGK